MGGGKKKYKKREKYISPEKKLGKYKEVTIKKNKEDTDLIINLWKKHGS